MYKICVHTYVIYIYIYIHISLSLSLRDACGEMYFDHGLIHLKSNWVLVGRGDGFLLKVRMAPMKFSQMGGWRRCPHDDMGCFYQPKCAKMCMMV